MKRRVLFFVLALAVGQGVFAQATLDITLKHGTPEETRTRDRATNHCPWVYQTVIGRAREIGQVMRDRKLIPAR